ncbi:cytochrome P450 [Paraburkholderia tropica]|uniref:cytochrome P450 n=1 Tax=Paraburkholderia tropica TaxID=92647 RepID=UPI002AB71BA0|nr:cytochrome P450 [Paraburkholderia tropica]
MLLEASVDNTGYQFALAMMHLLQDPGRWDRIVADVALIPSSINEAIRLTPKVATINRIAKEDTEVAGELVKQGTWVSISVLSAHRDTVALPDAATYDLDRQGSRPHLVFGGGMHLCLGMLLSMVDRVA